MSDDSKMIASRWGSVKNRMLSGQRLTYKSLGCNGGLQT